MKVITNNKKAFHDYEILKKYEAGISLNGSEVKSIRNNNPSIVGSFVNIKNGEAFLINMNIPEYQMASNYSRENSEPTRTRKLLLNKKEIKKLNRDIKEKRLIVIPLKVYWNKNSLVKIEIATARPLKKHDLREKEKEKAIKRNQW